MNYGDKFDAEIERLYHEKVTVTDTALILGVGKDFVRWRRTALGLKTHRGRGASLKSGVQKVDLYNDKIEELWRAGFSVVDIADDPDIYLSASAVSRRLTEMGYEVKKRYLRSNRIKLEELKQIEYLYNHDNKYSQKEIAKILGFNHPSSVRYRLERLPNVKKRSRSEVSKLAQQTKMRQNGKLRTSTST